MFPTRFNIPLETWGPVSPVTSGLPQLGPCSCLSGLRVMWEPTCGSKTSGKHRPGLIPLTGLSAEKEVEPGAAWSCISQRPFLNSAQALLLVRTESYSTDSSVQNPIHGFFQKERAGLQVPLLDPGVCFSLT